MKTICEHGPVPDDGGVCGYCADSAPVPPAGDVEVPILATVDRFGSLVRTGGVLRCVELVDRAHVTRLTAERDGLLAVADRRKSDQEQMCSDIVALQSELTKARELLKSGSSPNYVHCEAVMAFLERGSPQ